VITYQVSAESPTAIPTVIATTRVTRIALMLSLTLVSLVQNGPLASTGSIAEYPLAYHATRTGQFAVCRAG